MSRPREHPDPGGLHRSPQPVVQARQLAALADALLDEQAETGDPLSQVPLDRAVEHLADRLVDLADRCMTGDRVRRDADPDRSDRVRGTQPAPRDTAPRTARSLEERVTAGDPASCSAAAAALLRIAGRVPSGADTHARPPDAAAGEVSTVATALVEVREDLRELSLALQEHATALAQARRLWRRTRASLPTDGLRLVGTRVAAVDLTEGPSPGTEAASEGTNVAVAHAQASIDRLLSLVGHTHAVLARRCRAVHRTTVSA